MTNRNLLLGSVGHGYNDMYFYLFPMLIPLFRIEFNLNYSASGLIMTVYMAAVAVFSIAWGSLGDKMGYHRLLSIGFMAASIGLLLVTFAPNYYILVLLIALTSIGVSTFHPLATAMVSINTRKPGFSMGIFEGGGSIGGIFATVVMSLLINSWGWRWTTALLALPGFWLAYAFFSKAAVSNKSNQPHRINRPTTSKTLGLFFLGRITRGLAAGAVTSFLPSYILEAWKLTPNIGSIVYSTFFVGGLIGALYLGHLADRFNHILLVTITVLLPVPIIFLITQSVPLLLGIVLLIILGVCFIGFFPPHNRWIAEGITQQQRGKFFGLGMTLETIALAVSPGIFGFIADYAGLVASFKSVAIPWLISGLFFAIIFIREKKDYPVDNSRVKFFS
ncbi:MAG: MFS transporter [Mahellales bacterium]|jgi:FSR family fosmidomycin resistance protein-like MFS transporter